MATRTDLGKWMITNGRNYDPEVTYEEKTFVLYRNSTYISLQTVRGVEPSDDGVHWQLMAKGFAGSETQIEGYVFVDSEEVIAPEADPALDADKLGGNLPDYYAPQHEISDAFSETKSYAVGDYCIYLNALYRFTNAKAAGEWDGTAVVPVTLAQEIQGVKGDVEGIRGRLAYGLSTDILSFALSNDVKVGITSGHFSGASYSGDLPSSQLKYGTFQIDKRNTGSISIKCFDIDNNVIWTNSYSNQKWKGWSFLYGNNNARKIKHLGDTSLMDYLKNNVPAGNYAVISFLNLTDNPFKNMTYGYALVFKVWAISASWLIVAFNDSQQETITIFPD